MAKILIIYAFTYMPTFNPGSFFLIAFFFLNYSHYFEAVVFLLFTINTADG